MTRWGLRGTEAPEPSSAFSSECGPRQNCLLKPETVSFQAKVHLVRKL